jgi:hypothetical protein
MDEHTGRPLYVDVKASLKKVMELGAAGAIAIHPDGQMTMYSLLEDSDFGDGFMTSPKVVAQKAPVLNRLLADARLGVV